jgi:hypothetical protein
MASIGNIFMLFLLIELAFLYFCLYIDPVVIKHFGNLGYRSKGRVINDEATAQKMVAWTIRYGCLTGCGGGGQAEETAANNELALPATFNQNCVLPRQSASRTGRT